MGGDPGALLARLGSADNVRFAMILGTSQLDAQFLSEKMYVGLGWLAPGTEYPAHAHDAWELYHVVAGRAQWGPSSGQLAVRREGEVLVHESGQPHMMVVPEDQDLLLVYVWTGDINGRSAGDCFHAEFNVVQVLVVLTVDCGVLTTSCQMSLCIHIKCIPQQILYK